MYRFEVKRNLKARKDVKFSAIQNDYLGLIFLDFDHQTQNFDFSKINNAYESKTFGVIKNGKYDVNRHTNKTHTKFQSNIFIFAVQW